MEKETLGDRVKKLRIALGWSQDELSKRMGYKSRSSINKIESGRPVTQKIIVRLAEVLYTTPSYLMGWEDEEEKITIQISKKWMDEVGTVDFTDSEINELMNFAKYIISKRSDK